MTSAPEPGDDTGIPPRQRLDSTAARIVGLIGSDRPAHRTVVAPDPPELSAAPLVSLTASTRVRPGRIPTAAAPADPSPPASEPDQTREPDQDSEPRPRHRLAIDAGVCAGFGVIAWLLTAGLWPDPQVRVLALNPDEQVAAEWFLAYGARIYSGDFALVTQLLNAPDGINLLANASVIVLAVLLGPLTLAAGAPVSFAVAVAVNLAATAAGWYLLFARGLGRHRFAAAAGAVLAGFGPGMASHSHAHLHVSAQWLVPGIVWCVLRLARPGGRRRRIGVAALLAVLVAVQYHLGIEVLRLTAVALVLFGAGYAAAAWHDARGRLRDLAAGLVVATAFSALVLAYPLWVRFAGPQHVRGGPFPPDQFTPDLTSLTAVSPLSLAGAGTEPQDVEYNAFFGVPLLLVIAGITLWLWRHPVAVAAAAGAATLLVLSLGPHLTIGGARTAVPGPYALVSGAVGPLPGRLALAAAPMFALLVCLAVHAALAGGAGSVRFAVPVAVVAALAPILPVPLSAVERAPVPRFFTDGHWRQCAGATLVPVPLPTADNPEAMRWAAAAGTGFALPEGLFVGPYGGGGRASIGTYARPTSLLFAGVAEAGVAAVITDIERRDATEDIAFWKARCVVLADGRHVAALRETVEQLFGPPQRIADVYLWKVG